MKKFISFSGGVESSTMLVLFGNKADAIFADTGYEHQLIYGRIEMMEKWCQNFHRPDFKIHRVKSKYGTLPQRILDLMFYPSFKTRYCTREFKIEPIRKFLDQFKDEGCSLLIGLNFEEQDRFEKQIHNAPFINYEYPLIENRLTRQACITILKKANLFPNFPVYMKRGGCIGCYYKSQKEYVAMSLLNPDEFKIVEDLENKLNSGVKNTRKHTYTILSGVSMKELRERGERMMFDPHDIYPAVNDMTQCGMFCNR